MHTPPIVRIPRRDIFQSEINNADGLEWTKQIRRELYLTMEVSLLALTKETCLLALTKFVL